MLYLWTPGVIIFIMKRSRTCSAPGAHTGIWHAGQTVAKRKWTCSVSYKNQFSILLSIPLLSLSFGNNRGINWQNYHRCNFPDPAGSAHPKHSHRSRCQELSLHRRKVVETGWSNLWGWQIFVMQLDVIAEWEAPAPAFEHVSPCVRAQKNSLSVSRDLYWAAHWSLGAFLWYIRQSCSFLDMAFSEMFPAGFCVLSATLFLNSCFILDSDITCRCCNEKSCSQVDRAWRTRVLN